MPQLDFTWWIINFFLIWASVVIVLLIITANMPSQDQESGPSPLSINKDTTEWQWF